MTSQHVLVEGESEARWQKHVMAALWVCIALLVALAVGLVYAKAYGLFQPGAGSAAPAWPAEWP